MELNTKIFDDTTINAVLQNFAYGLSANNHSSLSASPFQLVFGRDMVVNAIYLANWKALIERQSAQSQKDDINEKKNRVAHEYLVGESGYLHKSNINNSLSHFRGPFLIRTIHTYGTVTIQLSPTVFERINIRQLPLASTRSS
jgi:hypothetical protein